MEIHNGEKTLCHGDRAEDKLGLMLLEVVPSTSQPPSEAQQSILLGHLEEPAPNLTVQVQQVPTPGVCGCQRVCFSHLD